MKTFKTTDRYGVVKIRKKEYADSWKASSKKSRTLYRGRCARCNSTDDLETHHIIPVSKGGVDKQTNLITLCGRCHDKRHKHKRKQKRKQKRTTP